MARPRVQFGLRYVLFILMPITALIASVLRDLPAEIVIGVVIYLLIAAVATIQHLRHR